MPASWWTEQKNNHRSKKGITWIRDKGSVRFQWQLREGYKQEEHTIIATLDEEYELGNDFEYQFEEHAITRNGSPTVESITLLTTDPTQAIRFINYVEAQIQKKRFYIVRDEVRQQLHLLEEKQKEECNL